MVFTHIDRHSEQSSLITYEQGRKLWHSSVWSAAKKQFVAVTDNEKILLVPQQLTSRYLMFQLDRKQQYIDEVSNRFFFFLLQKKWEWAQLHDKVSLSKEQQTHIQTDCNDIRPQTAQFYNERILTDLNLVNWQSTVHGPPEDGFKNGTDTCRGKYLSVFNVNFSAF
jgi:hypothetical protein